MSEANVGLVGQEVMRAFAQAAALGLINDDQDVYVNIKVLEALVGLSPHAVAGAIGHLLQGGLLAQVEGTFIHSDDARQSRWLDWYGPTVRGGEWLVTNDVVPADLVGALYPESCGWTIQDIEHFATDLDCDLGQLEEWGRDVCPENERLAAARDAHAQAMKELER